MPSQPHRDAPLNLSPQDFRSAGHALVDRIADFLAQLPQGPVTSGETPAQVRAALGEGGLPEGGAAPAPLLSHATDLVLAHSLFNGHPRFFGYITSSAAPIGTLGDLLAAGVNANVGAFTIAPLGTEMERQTVRWIAELIGYPATGDGILVSGGNMANFVCFLAARRARAPWPLREQGIAGAGRKPLRVYASSETHTWVQKACDMFGLGTDAIRYVDMDAELRLSPAALEKSITQDKARGEVPLLVVATMGSVGTGAVDPIREIAAICKRHGVWLHADGAYGALAAALPEAPEELHHLALADSVAVDPHKWLYAPLEAGCAVVREPNALVDAFSYRPPYYHHPGEEADPPVNYYEHGPQNSRGFRALKVWLGLRQAGRQGYVRMMSDDCRLARYLFARAQSHARLQAFTCGLSIATFRFVPVGATPGEPESEEYLNKVNTELLTRLQMSGRAYPSNAVIRGAFVLRACIVNFRTTEADCDALIEAVVDVGQEVDREMQGVERTLQE